LIVIFNISQIIPTIPRIRITGTNKSLAEMKLVLFPKMKISGNNAKRIGCTIVEDEKGLFI
tara:strand:+ start:871 stop:1053 length:183 start_codon:yes stop_codon:yes gene_type:complete